MFVQEKSVPTADSIMFYNTIFFSLKYSATVPERFNVSVGRCSCSNNKYILYTDKRIINSTIIGLYDCVYNVRGVYLAWKLNHRKTRVKHEMDKIFRASAAVHNW